MDYAIWSEVERRMRLQERSYPDTKHETRDAFERRLNQVARKLSADFIDRSISDLKRRCELLYEAEGGLFEEGGRARRPM